MKRLLTYLLLCCTFTTMSVQRSFATPPFYMLEAGVFGGTAYYVGDVQQHIFMNPRYTGGLAFSFKLDRRWTFTAKSQYTAIGFPKETSLPDNKIINTDIVAEFNFFRFDMRQYDPRIKPITPYIYTGLGWSNFGKKFTDNALYIPFGIGLKWKMHPRWTMNLAWQHHLNLFLDADNFENNANYNNTYKLNKVNILRNDVTSTLTLGITFAFLKRKPACKFCD